MPWPAATCFSQTGRCHAGVVRWRSRPITGDPPVALASIELQCFGGLTAYSQYRTGNAGCQSRPERSPTSQRAASLCSRFLQLRDEHREVLRVLGVHLRERLAIVLLA